MTSPRRTFAIIDASRAARRSNCTMSFVAAAILLSLASCATSRTVVSTLDVCEALANPRRANGMALVSIGLVTTFAHHGSTFSSRDCEGAILIVADGSPGSAAILSKIFDDFFSLNRPEQPWPAKATGFLDYSRKYGLRLKIKTLEKARPQ